jgi:uncharacterized protein (TIGR02598 family)
MKRFLKPASGFSLVEVVLALGVAGFCLIAVLGMLPAGLKIQQGSVNQTKANAIILQIMTDLRADVRLPPGQVSKANQFGLNGHWLAQATPDTLYFTNDGKQTTAASTTDSPVFRATITYLFPPTATTSIAKISVSWPAQVDPATAPPAGSAETFVAVNR